MPKPFEQEIWNYDMNLLCISTSSIQNGWFKKNGTLKEGIHKSVDFD